MSDCSTHEACIGSLISDIHKLKDENYELEQRYKQLEQVARKMLHVIHRSWEEAEPVSKHSMKEAVAKMNELGVTLDD